MVRALKHRGPDDEGFHTEPGVGLGMTRLAIIDPESGRQPMASADGATWLVFNGEIYNFRALRAELEGHGVRFRTRSDTEVLLAAWQTWGEASLERVRGMFAFALWERRARRLVLARDRLGKKPLYLWQGSDLLLFASEPKAILVHPAVDRALDWQALRHYLAFGYTPGERSIFAAIRKLPAAHVAAVEAGRLSCRRYWALPPGQPFAPRTRAEAAAAVRRTVVEAVRLRLESDVPVGVFLSGGIDSSVVVAALREITGGRIATFTVGFGRTAPSYDERAAARLVAQRFGTDHHEELLEPRVADLLPALVHHFDEPFADSSAVPTFVVAQATARHVRVALSGLGGDETFAGYPRYLGVRLSERYAAWPQLVRRIGRWGARALAREGETSRNWTSWARRFLATGLDGLPDRYLSWTRVFDDAELEALAMPALRAAWTGRVDEAQRAAFAGRAPGEALDGVVRIDLTSYLPDDLLVMADRMGMAHGLEVRAPFCDHRVVELALALAPGLKLPGWRLKGLLKAAFADVLPPAVLSRPKQGFMIPLASWLRGELRSLVEEGLDPGRVRARGLFAPGVVGRLVREHLDRTRNHADRLWALLILELWMQQYVDGRPPGGRP
jgi:asparagine synthase (glutamine-hydrolysing)